MAELATAARWRLALEAAERGATRQNEIFANQFSVNICSCCVPTSFPLCSCERLNFFEEVRSQLNQQITLVSVDRRCPSEV